MGIFTFFILKMVPDCAAHHIYVCWIDSWYYMNPLFNHRYNCNRYDEKEAQQARDAQAISRAALERYLHYCNRYMNHFQSSKFEKKLYNMVKEKMETMQKMNMSWIEVSSF